MIARKYRKFLQQVQHTCIEHKSTMQVGWRVRLLGDRHALSPGNPGLVLYVLCMRDSTPRFGGGRSYPDVSLPLDLRPITTVPVPFVASNY